MIKYWLYYNIFFIVLHDWAMIDTIVLLRWQGLVYKVVPSPFNEDLNRPKTDDPREFTQWTASQKANAVVESLKHTNQPPDMIIGADTVVVHNSQILGKPTSPENAVEMLRV